MVLPQRRDGAASPAEGLFGDQPSRAGAKLYQDQVGRDCFA